MNRNLALIVIGQAISSMGDYLYLITLQVWVLALYSSTIAVSGVTLAEFLAGLLIGPVAGVFVDRWNRRRTAIVASSGQALAALLPILAPGVLRLPAIYASVFLIFLLASFTTPALSGLLQVVVESKQIPQAVSIIQSTLALASIVGSLLVTPLYLTIGPTGVLLIDAASFLIAVLCLSFLQAPLMALHPYAFRKGEDAGKGIGSWLRELIAGLRLVVTTRILLIVCMIVLIGLLGAGALQPISVVFIKQYLRVNSALSGLMIGAMGAGTLVGLIGAGMLAKWIAPRYLLIGGAFLLGLSIVVYSFQTIFLAALIVNLVIGIQAGSLQVGYLSVLMSATPKDMIGRVQALMQTGVSAMGFVSAGLAGYLGQFLPVNSIFAVSGILVALAGLSGWLALRGAKQGKNSYSHYEESVKEKRSS